MLHKVRYEKALGRTINDDYYFTNDIYDEDKVSALRKINKGKMNKMYVINYCDGIYAGTYDNANGTYLYSSNSSNKKEPKIFRTLKGVTNHISNLKKKIPYPDTYNFKIKEWTDKDYEKYLNSIGIDLLETKIKQLKNEKEKYWKKVFKKVKGEIEVIRIEIEDNVGIVTYYMPYSTYEHEFFFQADLDTDKVISAFCDAVNQGAENMIQTIRDCSKDLKNLF